MLVVSYVGAGAGGSANAMRFNGDTGSNYSSVEMKGDGSTASSDTFSGTRLYMNYSFNVSSSATNIGVINIMDYSADKHKSVLYKSNIASAGVEAFAGRWANTAAITSINLFDDFGAGSTFALYGIAS